MIVIFVNFKTLHEGIAPLQKLWLNSFEFCFTINCCAKILCIGLLVTEI